MSIRSSSDPTPARSVREEWLAGLPEAKQRAFQNAVTPLEAGYAMFSIAVNESFSLRRSGSLVRAREQVGTTAGVMHRFTDQLSHLLDVTIVQARESSHSPRVAPLNPAFFRWPISRRLASWESAIDLVLPTRGLRFRQPEEETVAEPKAYFDFLASQGILLDPAERKATIAAQAPKATAYFPPCGISPIAPRIASPTPTLVPMINETRSWPLT